MTKLVSFRFLIDEFLKILLRFPVTLFYALIITTSAHFLIWHQGAENDLLFGKIIISCYVGFCFSLATYLFFESRESNKLNTLLKHVILLSVPAVYFLSLYNKSDLWTEQLVQKNFVVILTGHLAVAFAAYLRKHFVSSFWEFNKTLLIRFVISGFYSVVICAGISGALLACRELFAIDINSKTYFTVSVWCYTFLQTCFFLAGITLKENLYTEKIIYSNPIKIFAQYILLPLAILYLGILYVYEIKILIAFNLPKGWVSSLVLAYAVVGLFCFLLLNPVKDNIENKWVKSTLKYFYFSIIPLLALLFISIFTRVKEYGITEERYYLIGLSLWLAGITLYGIISKELNIKLIPISLAFVHIVMVIGPLNGFTISRISQRNRLEELMMENGLWDGNKLVKPSKKIDKKNADDIRSIITYLTKKQELSDVNPLLGIDVISIENHFKADTSHNKQYNKNKITDSVIALINLPAYRDKNDYFTIAVGKEDICETNGAKFMIKSSCSKYYKKDTFEMNAEKLVILNSEELDSLIVSYQNKKYVVDLDSLKDMVIDLKKSYETSSSIYLDKIRIPIKNADEKINLFTRRINFYKTDSSFKWENIDFYILIK